MGSNQLKSASYIKDSMSGAIQKVIDIYMQQIHRNQHHVVLLLQEHNRFSIGRLSP